ncbi:MAG: DUF1501 domain-containing protein [Planctomycetaceae bacterium]|nr:DUF1501 domain-containing protein [Planctomycetaceae bacterium]
MFSRRDPEFERHCTGPRLAHRREFLRVGLAGLSGLTLPGLLRLRAAAATENHRERTAVIVVWLIGGASHLETYDPKPHSGSEYCGPYRPISTTVPDLQICELLPRHAQVADKFTILRSLVHTGFCHQQGAQQLLTGHPVRELRQKPDDPDLFSITNLLRSDPLRTLPNYVGVNPIPYVGSAYLGPAYEPFAVTGDPNDPKFEVPNLGLADKAQVERLGERIGLRKSFDRLERDIDRRGNMQALDAFESQAWNVLTSSATRKAFDINQEDPRVRERYGRNAWGQQCLMARRLVESGVDLVTTTFNGPLCGRVQNWDDHAVNHNVFEAMQLRAPLYDQAVTALIDDLHERGLDKRVLVIVTGEFGRTPKISYVASTGGGRGSAAAGTMQPGRDHWPSATSLLFSGGGISEGQVIGATDSRGEYVTDRIVGAQDFLATVYRHLGVDAARVEFTNFAGRPVPILGDGKPIRELTAAG